jgi:hypothetical protein
MENVGRKAMVRGGKPAKNFTQFNTVHRTWPFDFTSLRSGWQFGGIKEER